ncbi:MAG: tRNA lysidine(34) synthetase TilS [Kiritimatiellae bacterium]|nr:tRNA lysidine(34) synthetase TilS [Kiritimatiellia bacterium]
MKMNDRSTELYCTNAADIENLVQDFAEIHLRAGSIRRLGVALSGGADSVALFHLLLPLCRKLGVAPFVLHLNHGLRAESEEEAIFVADLARANQLPLTTATINLQSREPNNLSLEMAAREARLRFYSDCMASCDLDAIATGHHADDLCETLLLRLARGSGSAGLAGMRPMTALVVSGGCRITLIRPLLNIAAVALREWLTLRKLRWHDDLSNLDTTIQRNNMRHNVLPFLRENVNPRIDAQLCCSAATLREDEAFLNDLATERLRALQYNRSILLPALLKEPLAIQRRVLRLWFFAQNLAAAAGFRSISALLAQCASPESKWRFQLAESVIAARDQSLLSIVSPKSPEKLPELALKAGETLHWGGFTIQAKLAEGIGRSSQGIGVYPVSCSLDATKLEGKTIMVRQRRDGDRIAPTGMRGSRKVKDVLIDAKVPLEERDTMPLISCEDQVLWIPGYRISRNYAVSGAGAPSLRITVTKP